MSRKITFYFGEHEKKKLVDFLNISIMKKSRTQARELTCEFHGFLLLLNIKSFFCKLRG